MTYNITNGEITFVSDSYNAEPRALGFNGEGVNYLWRPDSIDKIGASICFPLLGAVPNGRYTLEGREYLMDMHGFAQYCVFEVEEKTVNRIVYGLTHSEMTLAQYPYLFHLRVAYSLEGPSLATRYTVENCGDTEMYFSVGGHPRFACPIGGAGRFEDYFIEFCAPVPKGRVVKSLGPLEVVERHFIDGGKRLVLDGELFAAGAFCLSPVDWDPIWFKSENSRRGFKLETDKATHIQFWAQPGGGFLCIEPWFGSITSLPALLEDSDWKKRPGTLRIRPGVKWSGSYTVTISR